MYLFDIDRLNPGDILLTAATTATSKAVRATTWSQFSHAILYVGKGSYIHSDKHGVHSGNIQRLHLTKLSHGMAFRVCGGISAAQIQNVCDFARNEIGKQYSVKEAARTTRTSNMLTNAVANRQFCSRLVAQAYDSAGIQLATGASPSYCSPKDIAKSPRTERVAGCLRPVAVKEFELSASDDPSVEQTRLTNEIFDKIRVLTGQDIQTFEQLANYLIRDSQHDAAISAFFQASGYMHMWVHDKITNPWRYDGPTFANLTVSHEVLRHTAERELAYSTDDRDRFCRVYTTYMDGWQARKLKFFSSMLLLYRTLIDLHQMRIDASQYVLADLAKRQC